MTKYLDIILIAAACLALNSCDIEEVNIPPTPVVRITSPTASTVILDSTKILIEASDDRGIAQVVLTIDGKIPPGGILLYEPYEYIWNTQGLTDSSVHILQATAFDTDSNTTSTPKLSIVSYRFSPANLQAIVIADTVLRFTWTDNSSQETGFELYESINDSLYIMRQSIPPNTTSTDLHGVFLSTKKYSYFLNAVIGSKRSKQTNTQTVFVVLSPPQGVYLNSITDTMIDVRWQKGTNAFEDSVEVEQKIGNGSFVKFGAIKRDIRSAKIPGSFKTGTTYFFRARAFSRYHTSAYSNIVNTNIQFDGPTQLSVFTSSTVPLQLNWKDNSSFEKGFSVERSTNGIDIFSEIHRTGVNVTSWTDTTPDTALAYRYRVRAFSDSNLSQYSQSIFVSRFSTYSSLFALNQRASEVTSVRWRPNSDQFASAHADGSIDLWNRATGNLLRTISPNSRSVFALGFSSDGSIMAAGGGDGSVTLWNPSTGALIQTIQAHSKRVNDIDFSAAGLFVTAGSDSLVKTWNQNTGQPVMTFSGHSDTVSHVRFHPNGNSIISGSKDKTLRSFNTQTAAVLWTHQLNGVKVNSIAFNKAGNTLAVAQDLSVQSNPVLILNSATGDPSTQFPFLNITSNAVIYSPNDKLFVTASNNGILNSFDLNFDTIYSYFTASTSAVTGLAFDPSTSFLVTGFRNGKLSVWSVDNYWRYSQ